MTLLLVCAAATWFMTGLAWFVQLVHYPLFEEVGVTAFPRYHALHSRRTMALVAAPMTVELMTALALCVNHPPGVSAWLAYVGAAAAAGVWALTTWVSVPLHTRLSQGFDKATSWKLVTTNWPRTLLWSLHALIVSVMLSAAVA